MKRRSRGITIVELTVASMVLGMLGLLTVVLFRTGASGWKKMEAQSGLLADYQVLESKLGREVRRSVFGSASAMSDTNGTTVIFLSAMDDSGNFAVDEDTYEPRWQKYLVFYWDRAARRVYLNEVKLAAGSDEIEHPGQIEDYADWTGNLEDYRKKGRLLMTDVDECTFTLADTMLTLELSATKKRYGDEAPEKLDMLNSIAFRN